MSVQVNRPGNAKLEGTIASISGTTIVVNSWGGQWNIDTSTAKLQRRFGGASSLSEFAVGDQITINGTASTSTNWTIIAKQVRDETIQQRNVNPTGTISNLNVTGKTFTLTTSGKNSKTYNVTTTDTTKFINATSTITINDLQNTQTVRVNGVINRNDLNITAAKVTAIRMPKKAE
jgi:hypothetical protein